jgi:60 kDa SS-A/Ro ribonucleoprotein
VKVAFFIGEQRMKLNVKQSRFTHEGAKASITSPIEELRRTVCACLLWESGFYESGEAVADRIKRLVAMCDPNDVAALAIRARSEHKLRHVSLLLVRELARDRTRCQRGLIADTLATVIQRADELTEFLAIYWADGRKPLSKQVKLGLARAFCKFDEYALGKYNRDGAVKLKDVLFLTHPKPRDDAQDDLWRRLVNGELTTPDTWEVALSGGADKRETFERLLHEKKLGYLALLRNLRNMHAAGVDSSLVFAALTDGAKASRALPFRFVAAARAVPAWESQIDAAMQLATDGLPKLPGRTAILVDISGSMGAALSAKSDLSRLDAAKALAILIRGISAEARVFRFDDRCDEVPAREGMALADAIGDLRGGTMLGAAIKHVRGQWPDADRIVVVTDEQSADSVGSPGAARGYMINVAANKNGVGYGDWTHVHGFSESVVSYIASLENN